MEELPELKRWKWLVDQKLNNATYDEAEIRNVPSVDQLVSKSDLILSILVPAKALDMAELIAGSVRRTGCHPVYADMNAIAPQTVMKINLLNYEVKNRTKLKEFGEINKIFEKNNIDIIPLKGIALSYLIYKNMPFRNMNDIDILIRQKDLNKTCDLLNDNGFKEFPNLKNRWHAAIKQEFFGQPSKNNPFRSGRISFGL